MRMQTTPGQSIQTISGRRYTADENGVIEDVDGQDVSELRRVGCRDLPTPAPAPAPSAVEHVEEISPALGVGLDPAIGHHEAPERSEQ